MHGSADRAFDSLLQSKGEDPCPAVLQNSFRPLMLCISFVKLVAGCYVLFSFCFVVLLPRDQKRCLIFQDRFHSAAKFLKIIPFCRNFRLLLRPVTERLSAVLQGHDSVAQFLFRLLYSGAVFDQHLRVPAQLHKLCCQLVPALVGGLLLADLICRLPQCIRLLLVPLRLFQGRLRLIGLLYSLFQLHSARCDLLFCFPALRGFFVPAAIERKDVPSGVSLPVKQLRKRINLRPSLLQFLLLVFQEQNLIENAVIGLRCRKRCLESIQLLNLLHQFPAYNLFSLPVRLKYFIDHAKHFREIPGASRSL